MNSSALLSKTLFFRAFIMAIVAFILVTNNFGAESLFLQKGKLTLQQQSSRKSNPGRADTLLPSSGKTDIVNGRYMAFFSLGMLPGSMDILSTTPLSLGMSHGYYSHGLFIGGGMAVENFQPAFLPVFADIRFFLFPQKPIHPWVKMILGKNFLFSGYSGPYDQGEKNTGGIVAGIGTGLSYQLNARASFYFYLGYRSMKYSGKQSENTQNPIVNYYTFNRMEFRIGFNF